MPEERSCTHHQFIDKKTEDQAHKETKNCFMLKLDLKLTTPVCILGLFSQALCCRLNVCVPLNSYLEIQSTILWYWEVFAFGRQIGHDGGTLMSGTSTLETRPQRAPSPFLHVMSKCSEPGSKPHQTMGLSTPLLGLPSL